MSSFKPSYSGLGDLLRSEEMQGEMKRRVDRAMVAAVADAPVGPPSDKHRGEYKASFETEVTVEATGHGGVRAVGHLRNNANHAIDVEYGGGGRSGAPKSGAHHTLARSLDFAGD